MSPSNYKAYQTSSRQSLSATEATALLLDTAYDHMQKATQAIVEGNIERRFQESEKATLILGNLESALVRVNETQSKTADALKDYYDSMVSLITRMNMKNDKASAEAISESLKTMADEFRKVSVLHEKSLHETSEPTETLKVGA
tara:strand:- start:256 stop:687 length:432 start_codon:yes stop_codon:yes gene_type:complete